MIFRSVCVILFFNVCWNFFLILATYRNNSNIIVIYILNINDKIFVNRKESFEIKVTCIATPIRPVIIYCYFSIEFFNKKNK